MTDATQRLSTIATRRVAGESCGITSVCSAHPLVIEAALIDGKRRNADVLIEATCNQVNQDGGYTGMTPRDFRDFVLKIAHSIDFDPTRLILGGDHLGPNPWKHMPADAAMEKAQDMIESYASAGFTKLHLDTSMGCAGEPVALCDEITAARAASLAVVAEAATRNLDVKPIYIIGTEVPIPGGAMEAIEELEVTKPEAAHETIRVHREAFTKAGIADAFNRAVGAVVQPGVEFGNTDVVVYKPERARDLSSVLSTEKQFVFEAHSTDYQPRLALRALVRDGFAILKVGPALTFALREALYGLSEIARILTPDAAPPFLPDVVERAMLATPANWRKYYDGSDAELALFRHFSLSDRVRYYWPTQDVQAAVDALMTALGDRSIPLPLIGQYLGRLYESAAEGQTQPTARNLILGNIGLVLADYQFATMDF